MQIFRSFFRPKLSKKRRISGYLTLFLKEFGQKQWTKRCVQEFSGRLLVYPKEARLCKQIRRAISKDKRVPDLAKELGIHENTLYKWMGMIQELILNLNLILQNAKHGG